MPFVFIVLGLVFLVTAIRGTQGQMFALVKSEFVGTNSFVPWASSILILGAIGYAKPVRPVTDAMIGLILLAMLLGNKGGFFAKFNDAIRNPTPSTETSPPAYGTTALPTSAGVQPTGDIGLDNILTGLQGIQ